MSEQTGTDSKDLFYISKEQEDEIMEICNNALSRGHNAYFIIRLAANLIYQAYSSIQEKEDRDAGICIILEELAGIIRQVKRNDKKAKD